MLALSGVAQTSQDVFVGEIAASLAFESGKDVIGERGVEVVRHDELAARQANRTELARWSERTNLGYGKVVMEHNQRFSFEDATEVFTRMTFDFLDRDIHADWILASDGLTRARTTRTPLLRKSGAQSSLLNFGRAT